MPSLLSSFGSSLVFAILFATSPLQAFADTAAQIDRDVDSALQKRYKSPPVAAELSKVVKGVLVYPDVIKAGLGIGGQYAEGHCASTARRLATTTQPQFPMVSKLVRSHSATPCFS